MREGASKNTSVAGTAASSAMRVRRPALFGGRNPANRNASVGSPATASALSVAEAPGSASTRWPASMASRTSFQPGSETRGVPASDISAMR